MTTQPPPSFLTEQRKKVLKYIGMALSALSVLTVVTVFALILRNESAFDEQSCPFEPAGERPFDGGKVIEEKRTCVNGIAEHRFIIARPNQKPFELARKRLAAERFDNGRFAWDFWLDEQKRLVINMVVEGKPSSEFREEDAIKH